MNKNILLGLGAIGGAIYLATSKKAQAKVKKTTGLSDKQFSSPEDAFKYIQKNKNKGKERVINDSIHFGVGNSIYTYKEDAEHYKIKGKKGSNSAFVHLTSEQTLKMLEGLMEDRGYLYSE